MKKIIWLIIAILIFTGLDVADGYYVSSVKNELTQAQAKIELLEKARKLSQEAKIKANAARQVENEKSKEREQLMQNILDGHCDWSCLELPDDVAWMLQYGEAGDHGIRSTGNAP